MQFNQSQREHVCRRWLTRVNSESRRPSLDQPVIRACSNAASTNHQPRLGRGLVALQCSNPSNNEFEQLWSDTSRTKTKTKTPNSVQRKASTIKIVVGFKVKIPARWRADLQAKLGRLGRPISTPLNYQGWRSPEWGKSRRHFRAAATGQNCFVLKSPLQPRCVRQWCNCLGVWSRNAVPVRGTARVWLN
jgi:hypothetical protein